MRKSARDRAGVAALTAAADTADSSAHPAQPAASDDAPEPSPSAPVASAPPSSSASKPPTKSKFCLNCQKDLTRNIRITCAECLAPTTRLPLIELCVECFAFGAELGGHKKTHKYTVSDCLAFPLVRERIVGASASASASAAASTAAATTSSAGHSGSSHHAGTSAKTAVAPTPSAAMAAAGDWVADEELLLLEAIEMLGMGNWKDIAEYVGTKSERKCEAHYLTAYLGHNDLLPRFVDEPVDEAERLALQDESGATSPQQQQQQQSDPLAAAPSADAPASVERPAGSELAGYMPLRGDFDVEYENEAELILADMAFSDDDHPTERELKLKVLEIYNAKLDERARRKQFVLERGLLDYKKHQQSERRRPKDEREIIAQMRPFARFQTPQEHEEFVEGLITAMRLRKQILLLQEYRKNGVRTLAEAELYDAEKKKRETEQALQKERESASYLYDSARTVSGGRDRASRWHTRESTSNGGDAPDGDHPRTRASTTPATTSSGDAFDIDGTPGSHLLTPNEKELCSRLKLLPKHYLVIKDALVRECFRLGFLTEQAAKDIVKIDVNKTGQIYEFFVNYGWICTEANAKKVEASAGDTMSNGSHGSPRTDGASDSASRKRKAADMSKETAPS